MRNALRILMIAAISVVPAWAGITFTQVTESDGGRGPGAADSVIKVWAEGGQAKMEWAGSSNPMFSPGSYMLVNEKGEMTIVDPGKKTYSKFDLTAMMEGMEMGMGAGSMFGFKMEVQDPKVEKVLEEPGGELLGYPTTHFRWHTSWTMVMKMPSPMRDRKTESDTVEDVWTTTEIGIPSAASQAFAGMGQGPMMAEMRKIAETAKAKMTGFPLKHITVSKGSGMHGAGRTITTTTVVKDIQKADIPSSVFVIPADYTETDMMQRRRGPAMPNLNDLNLNQN